MAPLGALLLLVLGSCGQDTDRGDAAVPASVGASTAGLVFESVGWYAVFGDDSGAVHALRERFDRISRVEAIDAGVASGTSHWRFDAVMRVDGAIAHGARPPIAWRSVQRVAAGLADARLEGAPSTARFGVLGHRVSRDMSNPVSAPCAANWQIELGEAGQLEIDQSRCPVDETLGSLTRSISEARPARLSWLQDGVARKARGIAWQRHLQGELPPPGGAVIFDSAVVTLAGVGTLALTRSRRRNGRGQPVVTGTVLRRGLRVALEDPRWTTAARDAGLSSAGRLQVSTLGIDVSLATLALPATSEPASMASLALVAPFASVVLLANGSHSGAGYAELAEGSDQR